MANLIELAASYVPMLDEVYALESCTSDLDGSPELVKEGANANELVIPMLDMEGLADYDRNSGYVGGDVTMRNETVKCNFDRGRSFSVDNCDNAETAGLAFGKLSSEFIRTKVVPELDAFRFASYAGKAGIGSMEGTLEDGAAVIKALSDAQNYMDEEGVPENERHLRITPTLLSMVRNLDTTKSREVLDSFASIKRVPQKRFYTAIEQLSGKNDEKAGGYRPYPKHYEKCSEGDPGALKVVADGASPSGSEIKVSEVTPVADPDYTPIENDYVRAVQGAKINFMILHKPALIQFPKHKAPKIVSPEVNQDADAWKYGYRMVGIADVYANKLSGVFCHHQPAGV